MEQVVLAMSRRGVALAWCLAVFVFLGSSAARAQSTVYNSKHDFKASSVAVGGTCGACHISHGSQGEYVLWSRVLRGLGQEEEIFNQRSNPDYARGFTIACYDCHANPALVDNVPLDSVFPDVNRPPQDVAFDDDMKTTYPRDSSKTDDKPGFYENVPSGTVRGTSTYESGHYVKNNPGGGSILQGDKLPCGDCHDPHRTRYQAFIREDLPNASKNLLAGNKASTHMAYTDPVIDNRNDAESRRFCIACHGTSEQAADKAVAFSAIKPSYGNNTIAKPTTRISAHLSAKTTACTKCHKHNAISVSCEDCHGFPPLQTIAEAGGSFDKLLRKNAENYSGGAGAHLRHRDALGENTIFQCEICHGPDPGSASWHNNGSGVFPPTNSGQNVNIIGLDTYWAPAGYPGSITPAYSGSGAGPPPGDAAYVFSSMGGGQQRCTGVACHGNPLASETAQLNWDDDMIDGDVPERVKTGEIQICKWCHDTTPAMIDFNPDPVATSFAFAPSVMGNGLATAAGFGAEVNGHGVGLAGAVKAAYDKDAVNDALGAAGAAKECTVCHDASYFEPLPLVTQPRRTHFGAGTDPRDEKRLRDTINSGSANIGTSTTFPTGPDQACSACHQNGVNTAVDGLDVSHHGIPTQPPPPGGYVPNPPETDPAFTRACRQCHEVHGANWNGTGRNLFMVGKWLDLDGKKTPDAGESSYVDSNATTSLAAITTADNAVVFTATTGADSFDENDGPYDITGAADRDDVCATCHPPAAVPGSGAGTAGGSHAGTTQGIGEQRGSNCTTCHDHDYDNNSTTVDAFMPSGCFGCHGRSTADGLDTQGDPAYKGQYWPDGTDGIPPYADDDPGAHYRHVQALALQLFGETPALVIADSANGTTYSKQKAICLFCHNDPGGGGHNANDDVRDPLNRVTVFLDSDDTAAIPVDVFRKLTVGPRASGQDRTSPAPVNGDQAYSYTNLNCTNLVCHNQNPSPTLASVPPGTWDAPPNWAPGVNADCSNTTCHAAGVIPVGTYTNAHTIHVGNAQKNYACTECHPNNYAPVNLGHGNGEIDMLWNNPASIEGSVGADNGFYDKEPGGAASPGDTAFAYKSGVYNVACNLVYCHGGDTAAWGGGDITPVWDNSVPDSVYCGSCHDGNGTIAPAGDASVTATGNHTDHLTAAYGPRFADPAGIGPGNAAASCVGTATTGCHTPFDIPTVTATHVNGSTEFANIVTTSAAVSVLGATAPAGAPNATSTDRCNSCHSTLSVTVNVPGPATVTNAGTVLAKTNWAPGAYTLPCLTCHNGTDAATVFANGTGAFSAPDMLGTDLANGSGAEIRGHNRSLADLAYPGSNNPPAARTCDGATGCHDAAAVHINNVGDTTYVGNRMLALVNGIPATTATMACNNCHATAAPSPATIKNVNMHGNTNYAGRLEELFPAASGNYAMECSYCHEPHGRTANGTGYNISMVPSTITVPTPLAILSASGVRFEAKSGPFSFNDGLAPDTDDLCLVCHAANSMNYNEGGYHAAPGYDNDEEGSDCSGCHLHNRDNNIVTVDGLMTVACNTCHTFDPGLPGNGVPAPHRLSASHDIHIGRPSNEVQIPNKGFVCNACHYQSSHNNAGIKPGDAWPAADIGPQLAVRFADPLAVPPLPQRAGPWNTVAAAGNPVNRALDSTSYNDTTNVCSNLYCHGVDAPFPAADAGTNTTPDWDLAATGDCGTCHRYTAATPPGSLAHPKHAGTASLPADPQYSIGCQVCHYTTTTDGTSIVSMPLHVNHSADVVFNELADTRVDAASTYNSAGNGSVGAPYFDCSATYCHSNGTDRSAPFDSAPAGSAAPSIALAWDSSTGSTCWSCHGDGVANSMPGYASGSPKANQHRIHNGTDADPLASRNTNGYGCQVCHWPTTQSGSAIVATTLHVNGSFEANDDGAGSALDQFAYTPAAPNLPGTCNNANCHGGNSGISWGLAGPIACDSCHSSVAGVRTAADVNNFAWDGTTQSKVGNSAGGEYETAGHGKPGVNSACAACHNNDVAGGIGHDRTMAGANPYRLRSFAGDQIAYCNTLCHPAGRSVRTHDPDQMNAAGIAPKRTPWPAPWNTPATSPRCVNCHDPHGDGANLAMVQRELYDKSPFQVNAAAPAPPTEQTNLEFTNDSAAPFVDSTAPYTSYADDGTFSSICQECHEATGGATGMVSFHDGPVGGTTFGLNHPGVGPATDCGDCHRHDAGFAPAGCEGCHNGTAANQARYPLAPNVMGPGIDPDGTGSPAPKPYDDGTWGYNVNGHGANGDANSTPKEEVSPGVFVPYLTPDSACTDCHDISLPPTGNGRHLNGILNSVDTKSNPSENTAHLKTDGTYPFIVASGSEHAVQVGFDLACYMRCHSPDGISNMRHAKDLVSSPGNVNTVPQAVRFGDKSTVADGESVTYPIDTALTTNASTAADDFATCISCHNPHGTSVVEPGRTTNRMARELFETSNTMCVVCHQ